jgi:hypothetical protein
MSMSKSEEKEFSAQCTCPIHSPLAGSLAMMKHRRLEVEDRATPERTTKIDMHVKHSITASVSNISHESLRKNGFVNRLRIWIEDQHQVSFCGLDCT